MKPFRFAGKVLAVIAVTVAALWITGALFTLSVYAGVTAVAVLFTVLYATADRWLRWLPGLLLFGVINSLVALSTGHAPTNRRGVSFSLSLLMLAFYSLGVFFASRLRVITHVDRVAWLFYMSAMVLPAMLEQRTDGTITKAVALPMVAGIAAILVAWTHSHLRSQRTSAGLL